MKLLISLSVAAMAVLAVGCGEQVQSVPQGAPSEDNITASHLASSFASGAKASVADFSKWDGVSLTCQVRSALKGNFTQWEGEADFRVSGDFVYVSTDESNLPLTEVVRTWSLDPETGEFGGAYDWNRRAFWLPFFDNWNAFDVVRFEGSGNAIVIATLIDADAFYWFQQADGRVEKFDFGVGLEKYSDKYLLNVARCFE